MTLAYLKEIGEAIGGLAGAGIKRVVTDAEPWDELRRLGEEWERKPRSTVRDGVMFHLGWAQETTAFVAKLAEERTPIPLLEIDAVDDGSHAPPYYYSPASDTMLMNACGLTLEDYDEFTRDGIEAAFQTFFICLTRVVNDLLQQCGARMPSLIRGQSGIFG